MTIQPEDDRTSKHRATVQEAARAAQEVLAEIEKLRAAAQAAASEKYTQWLTCHAQRLEVLARKAQHLSDAAAEACINAGHLGGEHLVELTATACRARGDLYRVYFSITA